MRSPLAYLCLTSVSLTLTMTAAGCDPGLDEEGELSAPEESISQHLAISQASGPGAEERYNRSLEDLRSRGERVIGAVVPMYDRTPENAFDKRWALVHLMGELDRAEAIGALVDVASAPLSEEIAPQPAPQPGVRSESPDEGGPRERQMLIRIRAVEGLLKLARRFPREGTAGLLKLLKADAVSAKLAAIALRRLPGFDPAKLLGTVLSAKEVQEVLALKFPSPSQVAQPRLQPRTPKNADGKVQSAPPKIK